MKTITGLYYSNDHEWVNTEGGKAYIGITDYAQKALGDIVYVELPEVDEAFNTGDTFGVVESVKAAVDMYMPISGTILEVNEALEDAPELVNSDPYNSWIISIVISDESELLKLMSEKEYIELCSKED